MGGACGCDAWLSGLPWVNIFLHKRGISDCIFIPLLQLLEMGVVVLERSVCRRRVQLQRCRQSSGPEHAQKDRTSDQRKRHDAPRQGIQSWPSHRLKQKTEKRNISKTILCLIESTRLYRARAAASRQRPTVTVTVTHLDGRRRWRCHHPSLDMAKSAKNTPRFPLVFGPVTGACRFNFSIVGGIRFAEANRYSVNRYSVSNR